jgi:hypothetical protein
MKAKIFILFIILVGCSSLLFHVDKMYKGPKRPVSEVSVFTGSAPAFLLEIDGEKKYRSKTGYNCCDFQYGYFVLGLEPGIHELVVQYLIGEVSMSYPGFLYKGNLYDTKYSVEYDLPTELSFTFDPGKIYQLKAQQDSVWIIEVNKIPQHKRDFY